MTVKSVKNITEGPKGLNSAGGPVLIEAGDTADVDLNDAELAVSQATGWFEISSTRGKKSAKAEDESPATEDSTAK